MARILPGGHVVAVGEAAGDDEDLVVAEQAWVLAEAVDVERARPRPRPCSKANCGFGVAVGAGGPEDQGVRRWP